MNTKNIQNINTGVNTGKAQLDIYIRPLDIFFSVPNDNKGIKKAASLIGVAPVTRESERYKGKRVIQGGRAQVRTVLYMAMISAMQCNPVFKASYTRLVESGKPKKVASLYPQDGCDLKFDVKRWRHVG